MTLPKPDAEAAMLVNQPYTLEGWYFNIVIRCNCEGKKIILLAGAVGAMNKCSHCGRFVQVSGFNMERNGTVTFNFNQLAVVERES